MKISTEGWLYILGVMVLGSAGLTAYAYTNFETVKTADERYAQILNQFTLINAKLDEIGDLPADWKPPKKKKADSN